MSNIVSWERVDIGQYLKLLSGFPFPSDSFSNSEGFPLIRIRDILDSKVETYFQGQYLSTYIVRKGDILIGMDGDFHIAKWKNKDALLNQRVLKLDISDPNKLDLNFIYYWFQPYVKKVNDVTAATTVKHLSLKDLLKAEGEIPTVLIQKKIANILQTIDQTIEKTEILIKKYQQLKAGLMHDLFTRGITADGKLRPSREQAPELYKETSIGWIPKDWESGLLKRFVRSAEYGISTSLSDAEIGIPVLRMNNIQRNIFDISDLKYTDNPEAYRIKLKFGDVLYNRTNSMEHVGKTAIWKDELAQCSFASYLVRINLHNDILLSEYFSLWMSQPSTQLVLRRYATPAVQQVNINPTNLQKLWISFPSSQQEQGLIISRINSVDERLKQEAEVLKKLNQQKSGLMHDLLVGKVPVKIDQTEEGHV